MSKEYTEEDTFNALRRSKLERVQEAIAKAQGNSFRLEHATLIAILKNITGKYTSIGHILKIKDALANLNYEYTN